ncbi:hypothetical protein [Paraburkholderia saeva]|uniref:hypothetical protein n=1 Tax=Paraburkholderia saeva TaxID=2777537 RepID=UPI0038993CA9
MQASETFNTDGSCTPDASQYSCFSTGTRWTLRTNTDGSPDNVFTSAVTSNLTYPWSASTSFSWLSRRTGPTAS